MKVLLLALALTAPAWATEENADKAAMFQQAKSNMLSNIDQRINNLNSAKTCINSAADGEALKACRKQMHESMKALKDDMKEQREGLRSKRDELRSKKREEMKKKRGGN